MEHFWLRHCVRIHILFDELRWCENNSCQSHWDLKWQTEWMCKQLLTWNCKASSDAILWSMHLADNNLPRWPIIPRNKYRQVIRIYNESTAIQKSSGFSFAFTIPIQHNRKSKVNSIVIFFVQNNRELIIIFAVNHFGMQKANREIS